MIEDEDVSHSVRHFTPPRRQQIQVLIDEAIARQDIAALMRMIRGPRLCACMGPIDDEAKCRCEMTRRQVCDTVSYFALRRGIIKVLRGART